MAVRRIVANISTADPAAARAFYEELLGLKLVMDFGWILTFASDELHVPAGERNERGRLRHAGARSFHRGG